mmetsp:Transcript_7433/g.27804  ORF Transcript_7433/g.27804 Transcript_7433/m.27804 type:complete len:464 (+) Transcript_7433:264-1655(+)
MANPCQNGTISKTQSDESRERILEKKGKKAEVEEPKNWFLMSNVNSSDVPSSPKAEANSRVGSSPQKGTNSSSGDRSSSGKKGHKTFSNHGTPSHHTPNGHPSTPPNTTATSTKPVKPKNPIVERLNAYFKEYSTKTHEELSMKTMEVMLTTPNKQVPILRVQVAKHCIVAGEGPIGETVGSVSKILCKSVMTDGSRSICVKELVYYQPVNVMIGTGSEFNKALEAFTATMRRGEVSYFECPAQDILGKQKIQIGVDTFLSKEHVFCAVVELVELTYQRPLPKTARQLIAYAHEDCEAMDEEFQMMKQTQSPSLSKVKKLLKKLRTLLQNGLQCTFQMTAQEGVDLMAERRKVIERIVLCLWKLDEFDKAAHFVNNELLVQSHTDLKAYQLAIHSSMKAHRLDEAAEYVRQALVQHGNQSELTKLSKQVERERKKHVNLRGTSFLKKGSLSTVLEDEGMQEGE